KMKELRLFNVRPSLFFSWTTEVLFFKGRHKGQDVFIKLYLDRRKSQRESRILEYVNSFSGELLVPEFIDDGVYSGGYFVLLERLEAKSLKTIMGAITFEAFQGVLEQFIYILGEFSRMEIVHCDITPDNIMVTKKGELVIIDFEYSTIKGSSDYQDLIFAKRSVLKSLGGAFSMPGYSWDDAYSFLSIAKEIINRNNFSKNNLSKIEEKLQILEDLIGENQYKN
ncbi:phosphotransferase, partial [Porticoccaceae bacterium]|nr:phosphotransferase [Porticoccaceae bacterium]